VAKAEEDCKDPGRIKRLDHLDSWVSIYLVSGIAEIGRGHLI